MATLGIPKICLNTQINIPILGAEKRMRNANLKYFGLILAFIGIIGAAGGTYMAVATQFRSTFSEQSTMILGGIAFLIIGLLMWIFIEE